MSPSAIALAGILLFLAGGTLAACLRRARALFTALFLGSSIGGCCLLAAAGVLVLRSGRPARTHAAWSVPGGAFTLELDALGGWFVLVIALVAAPVALYASSYFADRSAATRRGFAFFFNLVLAALALLAAAHNALLFLAAWELMTLGAYFLIVLAHEQESVRWSGRLYLFANHCATFCILALIAWLGTLAGSFDFSDWRGGASASGILPIALALVGFGTKAGIVPLHIWLPWAHPAAPTPISALLSGVVIKAGIFGLLRFLPFLQPIPSWCGMLVLLLGAVSGILGVLYALAQHDLKRLLAYHSVENIGIILLGIGAGILGARTGSSWIAVLGFAGALLHLLNHALYKSLLFLCAGCVQHSAGTTQIDRLGGLARRMPVVACTFLAGCASICALPPFNGFVSEWTVYRAMFEESAEGAGAARLWSIGGILALALIGGLAAACFAKAFGTVFLGVPREEGGHVHAGDAPPAQKAALIFLAAACLSIGLLPQLAVRAVWPAALELSAALSGSAPPDSARVAGWLSAVSLAGVVLIALIGLLAWARSALAGAGAAPRVGTWSCSYSQPNERMQYTSSSFAAGLLLVFRGALFTRTDREGPAGAFPHALGVHTQTPDAAESWIFRPAFAALVRTCQRLRFLQRLPVHVQVSFVVIVLAVLLVWKVTL